MIPQYITNLIIALVFTIIIECIIAFLFGYKDKRSLTIILLINLLTNPVLNYFLLLLYKFKVGYYVVLEITIILEIIIIIIEWKLLFYVFEKDKRRLLVLSIVMNFVSFLSGFIIL